MVPFPLFEPDRTPYLFSSGDNLVNCLPVQDGWGPMPSFAEYSDALPSPPRGAAYVKYTDDTVTIIVGTETNLYKLNTAAFPYTWDEISKTTDAYTLASTDTWQYAVFGDYLIATQLGNPPQVYDLSGGGNFADLGGSPPSAKHVWVAGDYLVFGWLSSAPNNIRWSGINDHTHWTVGINGADEQQFPDGGGVKEGIGDQRGAVIVFRDKMRRMQFSPGSGWTFTNMDINSMRGSIAENSIVQIADQDFVYLSEDGFFRGAQGAPIGAERVDRWFLENVDISFIESVQGGRDPINKVVWWRFLNINGASTLIGYDWQLDRWCYSNSDANNLIQLASPGVTIDGLDAYFTSMDNINVGFDSRFFAGGRPFIGGFSSDGKLVFSTESSQEAVLRTAKVQLNKPRRAFVNGARVETDSTEYTARIGSEEYNGEGITFDAAVSPETNKFIPFLNSGRFHQMEITIPAGQDWSVATSIQPEFVDAGYQ